MNIVTLHFLIFKVEKQNIKKVRGKKIIKQIKQIK